MLQEKKIFKNFLELGTFIQKKRRETGERILGNDPKSGRQLSVKLGKYGPIAQIGKVDEEEKPIFASLLPDQQISKISFDEALKLFDLPIYLGDFEDHKIALIKPREFINRSGKTLQLVRKYKVKDTKDILVVHDDMDLEPGDVKLKLSGGHAGHNGLRDILKVIGNEFVRLRFGIGHPPNKEQTDSWVIKKPNPQEKREMANAFERAINNIDKILLKDWMIIMNDLHSNEH